VWVARWDGRAREFRVRAGARILLTRDCSMETTEADASLVISSADLHQYRVVLCVWPALVSSEEDLSRLKVLHKHIP
jgi:hypothetical protein